MRVDSCAMRMNGADFFQVLFTTSLYQERMEGPHIADDRGGIRKQDHKSRHWQPAQADKATGSYIPPFAPDTNTDGLVTSSGIQQEQNDSAPSLDPITVEQPAPFWSTTSPLTRPSKTSLRSSTMPALLRPQT